MTLSIEDFQPNSINFLIKYYVPTVEARRKLGKEFGVNWIFSITKTEVFNFLEWKQCIDNSTHWDKQSGFPEFSNEAQAYLFLAIAIKLHNEKIMCD